VNVVNKVQLVIIHVCQRDNGWSVVARAHNVIMDGLLT